MKKVLFSLILICASIMSLCQTETHNFVTYDTTISIPQTGNPFGAPNVWICRISRPVNMFTVGNADTASRPVIITMPGQGELGANDTSKLTVYGPHYWLNNGWDGSVVLGNGTHYPILITNVYTNNVTPYAADYYNLLIIELNTFHIKRNCVYLGGLSQGAFTEGALITFEATAGAETGMKIPKAMLVFEGTPDPQPAPYNGWNRDTVAYKVWAAKYGGKYFYLEGSGSDNFRNGWVYSTAMNDSVPGSAYFSYETLGGGAHCCWNSMYDPSATNWSCVTPLGPNNGASQAGTNTMGTYKVPSSAFQWLLRQGDTTLVGTTLVSSAGNPQTITLPTSSVTLTGSGTPGSGGSITAYLWTRVSGPNTPTITSATSATTTVTGLIAGSYVFNLRVTDAGSNTANSTVTITVNSANIAITRVVPAEYRTWYIKSDSTIWAYNNGSALPIQFPLPSYNGSVKTAVGQFNILDAVDDSGFVYQTAPLAPNTNFTRVATDTTGAPFSGNWYIDAYSSMNLTIRADSSIWYWGLDEFNYFYTGGSVTNHTGVTMLPTQLSPGGMKFKKALFGSDGIIALTTAGAVYKFFAPSTTPVLQTTPRAAIDIFISATDMNGCIIPDVGETSGMGYPYVWCHYSYGEAGLYGGVGGSAYTTPTSVKTLWNMTSPIKEVSMDWNTIHYIDSLGNMYGIGFNPFGEVGNGQEFINKYYYPGFPGYGWDFQSGEYPTGAPPIQIGVGIKWKHLYSTNWFGFYKCASDVSDSIYSWGRNKSLVLGNGLAQDIDGYTNHPNTLDVLAPTMVHPMSSQFTSYTFTAPSINAGTDQSITASSTILAGTVNPPLMIKSTLVAPNGIDTAGYHIISYQWTQTAGPTTAVIVSPANITTSVTGLSTGVYKFSLFTIDNNTGELTDTIQITVNTSLPTANAGSNQTITLPTSSVTLTGSGTASSGYSLASVSWSQVSGPNASIIVPGNAFVTGVSGLIAGIYTFRLTVTDNSSQMASSTVQVTVNNAPVINVSDIKRNRGTRIKLRTL